MPNCLEYDKLKENILSSELVRIIFRAMYDTMWCRLGLQDLSLVGAGKETPGLKYDKGFTYIPRNLISWDTTTNEIPTDAFTTKPVTIEEFTSRIEGALGKDLATLLRPASGDMEAGIAINREIAGKLLWTIGTHISLGQHKKPQDTDTRAMRLLKSLTPSFLPEYGGRHRVFASCAACLANFDAYISELEDHYPAHFRKYMLNARTPLIGAAGKRLAEAYVMIWSNSVYGERFGGHMIIGGHEEKGYIVISLLTLSSATQAIKDMYSDEHLFARYISATDTRRDMVASFAAYKSLRYGTKSKLQFQVLISPAEVGLSRSNLAELTEHSFQDYRKILEIKRREFP